MCADDSPRKTRRWSVRDRVQGCFPAFGCTYDGPTDGSQRQDGISPARFVHQGGCECIAHVLQALCDLNPQTTVTSVNGVTAYDLNFRRATSTGFRHVDGGSASLLFVRMFHGSPSEYLWEDDSGVTKIWNKAGLRPGLCDVLERAARDRNHRPVCGGVQVCQWRSEASKYWAPRSATQNMFADSWSLCPTSTRPC